MQGIASILDREHSNQIERLWDELEREFGLKYACVAYPHFSYQVAEHYDIARAELALRDLANNTAPFTISTSGLGIFTGDSPVLDVRVVRTPHLNAIHQQIVDLLAPFTMGDHTRHYGAGHWLPHITLAMGDLTHDVLPDVVRLLSRRSFTWDISIDNIALVLDARGTRDQWLQFPFGGKSA